MPHLLFLAVSSKYIDVPSFAWAIISKEKRAENRALLHIQNVTNLLGFFIFSVPKILKTKNVRATNYIKNLSIYLSRHFFVHVCEFLPSLSIVNYSGPVSSGSAFTFSEKPVCYSTDPSIYFLVCVGLDRANSKTLSVVVKKVVFVLINRNNSIIVETSKAPYWRILENEFNWNSTQLWYVVHIIYYKNYLEIYLQWAAMHTEKKFVWKFNSLAIYQVFRYFCPNLYTYIFM